MARQKSVVLDAIGIKVSEEGSSDGIQYVDTFSGKPSDDLKHFIPDADLFEEMGKTKHGDWLSEHKESGQTYRSYLSSGKRLCPDPQHNTIYLLPLTFAENPVPPEVLQPLRDFAEIFFGMPVKLQKVQNLKGKVPERLNDGVYQVHAGKVLDAIKDDLIPPDAFCSVGITMCDLYPKKSWNFVFGLSQPRGRHGIYSIARCLSNFGEYETTILEKESLPSILVRTCKTISHVIANVFGLEYCIYYKCVMNGVNHLAEADSTPSVLCPVCLRKLHSACTFDIEARYQQMLLFWRSQKLDTQEEWVQKRLQKLQEHPSP